MDKRTPLSILMLLIAGAAVLYLMNAAHPRQSFPSPGVYTPYPNSQVRSAPVTYSPSYAGQGWGATIVGLLTGRGLQPQPYIPPRIYGGPQRFISGRPFNPRYLPNGFPIGYPGRFGQNAGPLTLLPTPIVTKASNGIHLSIDSLQWVRSEQSIVEASLGLGFQILNADGSPTNFIDPRGAIIVSTQDSEERMQRNYGFAPASMTQVSSEQYAQLENIDPRVKSVHVVFRVRNPSVTDLQTGQVASRVDFNNVLGPTQLGVEKHLNEKYTTRMGGTISLKGITIVPLNQFGQSRINFDMSTVNPRIPDDIFNISINVTDQTGRQIAVGSYNSQNSNIPSAFLYQGSIAPLAEPFNIEFNIYESSPSIASAVHWSSFTANIPLPTSPVLSTGFTVSLDSRISINKLDIEYQRVDDPNTGSLNHIVWLRPQIQGENWRVSDFNWASPGEFSQSPMSQIRDAFWHADGSPVRKGEIGNIFVTPRPNTGDIEFSVQDFSTKEQAESFSDVPLPKPGQLFEVNQSADGAAGLPLLLSSVQVLPFNAVAPTNPGDAAMLLNFSYNLPANANVSLASISSHDNLNNALHFIEQQRTSDGYYSGPFAGSQIRSISLVGGKAQDKATTFSLSAVFKEDIPNGNPIYLKADYSGHLSKGAAPVIQINPNTQQQYIRPYISQPPTRASYPFFSNPISAQGP